MKFSLAAALALASTAAIASANVITIPMVGHPNPAARNSVAWTNRYIQKRDHMQKRADATMSLINSYGDISYSVDVGLGTPVQTFRLVIDTGSPVTWVVGAGCVGSGCGNVTYNPQASTTSSISSSPPFSLSYVDGSAIGGNFYKEAYTLGALKFDAVIGVVNQDTAQMPPTVDGLMGLWYQTGATNVPFLNILANGTMLTNKIMGIWLQHQNTAADTSPGGELTIGGTNPARYTGDITYINCVSSSPWTIPVGGVSVNGKQISPSGAVAAIDTGTSAMLVPRNVSDAINGLIPRAQRLVNAAHGIDGWVLPCNGNTPVSFTFGTFTVAIPYTAIAMQNMVAAKDPAGNTYCLSAVAYPSGGVASMEQWILGDSFLTSVYSVYDFGTNAATGGRIGFAMLTNSGFGNSGSGNGTNGGSGGNTGGNNGGTTGGSGGSGKNSASGQFSSLSMRAAQALVGVAAIVVALL